MQRRTLVFLALASLAACNSEGTSPDAGVADDSPITERPSRGTFQCRLERDRTDHRPRDWRYAPPALVKTSNGAAYLARLESTGSNPFMLPPAQLLVSTFDVAGTFGPPVMLPATTPDEIGGLAAAQRGDGFVVVWVEGSRLRFAAFDARGENVVAAKDVLTGIDRLSTPRLAAGPDGGFGVVYAPEVTSGSREVRFAVLDAAGTVRMGPRPLTQTAGAGFAQPGPAIASGPGGYAMIWRDPAARMGGIDFAAADASGAQTVARHRISTSAGVDAGGVAGFEPPTTSLLATSDGYLAAWTEVKDGPAGASSVVRLVRLDSAGARRGTPVPLRAARNDVDEVEPTLVPFGDAVAVLWGRGQHIYICGGCIPDHSIELILLDPTTLTPLSNVVSLTNGGGAGAGGLLRRSVAVLGNSLLTTYLLTFHVHATPGSAVFSCTRN
jgi:hypothetical protein